MDYEREMLTPKSEAEWLEWRRRDLTSTQAAALFGASPYATEFELFHIKAGTIPEAEFDENERMKWGNRLEAAIANGIAEDMGLIVEPMKTYGRIPALRMGSSFDFKIVGVDPEFAGDNEARRMFAKHGPGIMEVKNVDGRQFSRAWIDDGEEIEAPPHIELQVQHQLIVADLKWSLIAPLVGGNTPKPMIRERDEEVCQAIIKKVVEFWTRVDAGDPPQPDFVADSDTIGRLYVENDGSSRDLSDNPRVAELCREYKAAAADEKAAGERKRAARAELITIIESAKSITASGFKISAGTNKESYRAYWREEGERWTITRSIIPATYIEATVPAFRNVRITEST